jgi:GTP-binding protein
MQISKALFKASYTDVAQCPPQMLPEYAFIGRSNVGKSSLVNALLNNKNLAKVSSTPGKTQTINYFFINNSWHLVDLPGYGFAKPGIKVKYEWANFISNYLKNREQLVNTYLLIDVRHPLQKNDQSFMEFMAESELPFSIIFTKADKLSRTACQNNVSAYIQSLLPFWEEAPKYFVSSAEKKVGLEEILTNINENNQVFAAYLKQKK